VNPFEVLHLVFESAVSMAENQIFFRSAVPQRSGEWRESGFKCLSPREVRVDSEQSTADNPGQISLPRNPGLENAAAASACRFLFVNHRGLSRDLHWVPRKVKCGFRYEIGGRSLALI
jgi:hypothetical protein